MNELRQCMLATCDFPQVATVDLVAETSIVSNNHKGKTKADKDKDKDEKNKFVESIDCTENAEIHKAQLVGLAKL